MPSAPHIVVIGAGAFGGWTALSLLRQLAAGRVRATLRGNPVVTGPVVTGPVVTLIDAWGPGNFRASSGGETRIIRTTYGSRSVYTRMAVEAMDR